MNIKLINAQVVFNFLSKSIRPLSIPEFNEFWNSLTNTEQIAFAQEGSPLSTSKNSPRT